MSASTPAHTNKQLSAAIVIESGGGADARHWRRPDAEWSSDRSLMAGASLAPAAKHVKRLITAGRT